MKPRDAGCRSVRVESPELLASVGYARVPDEFRLTFVHDPDEWGGPWPVLRRYTPMRAHYARVSERRMRLEAVSIWLPSWAVDLVDALAGGARVGGWNGEAMVNADFSLAATLYVAREGGKRWRSALLTTARVSPEAAVEMIYERALSHGLGRLTRAQKIPSCLYPENRAGLPRLYQL